MSKPSKFTYSKRVRSFLCTPTQDEQPSDALPATTTTTKKRSRCDSDDEENRPAKRKHQATAEAKTQVTNAKVEATKRIKKLERKPLTQLFLTFSSKPSLISCPLCALSFTRGSPEDEELHKRHCKAVVQGMEWGREDERQALKSGAITVKSRIKLSSGDYGRIVSIRANVAGKLGTKIDSIISTVNLTLSSPSLTQQALASSKVYLFLLPTASNKRERVVGCVVAQRISTAMEIARDAGLSGIESTKDLLQVDGGLYCRPEPLPTPLGISRIFVAKGLRRQGVASFLLTSVVETFVHGCLLDPLKGQVAFSQPTGDGQRLMASWGKGKIRVFGE